MSQITGVITKEYSEKDVKTYNPTEKESKTVEYVRDQWQASEDAKQLIIENTWVGLAFYTGRQWARYNRVTRLLTEDNPPPWRVRMVLNYILPTVETLAGKLTENRPGFIAVPASDDEDDTEAARQSERLLMFLWHELGMQQKIHEAVKWMAVSGTAFFKCWWDTELGESYEFDEARVDETIEYLQGLGVEVPGQTEQRKTGLPVVDVLSPLEVGWDPGAKDMDTCRWMIHANMLHIDEVRDRWPDKGKYVKPSVSSESEMQSQQILREFSRNSATTESPLMDRTMVLEYFEKPSPRHPEGYYAIVAGDIVLEEQEFLPYKKLPFMVMRHNTVPGRLAGEGVVTPLIPAQKELNKSVSQRIENKNLHAQPKWRAEKGSVDRQSFTDEPGEIIFYNRTAARPPEPLPPPPLSPEHRLLEKEQIEHITNLSGISDVARGDIPSQISGRAIGLISDMDTTRHGPSVRELEHAIERMAEMWLWMWREYMPIPATIQVIGTNHALEVLEFHASQIKTTRVRVQSNSMLPKMASYRREQIMQMYQVGMLGNPQDPATSVKARKLMEFGEIDSIYGDASKDRNYAREENYLLRTGHVPDVSPWEDHITHIDVHLDFMKTVDFRLLPTEVQANIERHVAWHYYAESQQRQGVPWWQPYVDAGVDGMPPGAMDGGLDVGEGGVPPQGMAQPQPQGSPPGLVGGGTPELNEAVGTRGPGVADYEAGFEA